MLSVAVLEAEQYFARSSAIDHCRARGKVTRAGFQAGTAQRRRAAVNIERRTAAGTHRRGDEGQAGPAVGAEITIRFNNFATGRASWREEQVESDDRGMLD